MIPILQKEIADAIRNRWLLGYTAALGLLGLAAAWVGLRTTGEMAFQMFGRTAATITNLSLLLAPLVAVVMGASAIAGERDRGTLQHLLAQPLESRELILGKYAGILIAIAAATLAGFAPAGAMVAGAAGASALLRLAIFPLISILLAASMLSLGFAVSVRSRGGAQAIGMAIFIWFAFVLLYDLVLIGTLAVGSVSPALLEGLLVANPVDAARVLVVLALEPDLYVLGPAGIALVSHFSPAGAAAVLAASLLFWSIAPLAIAVVAFRRAVVGPTTFSILSACSIGKELSMKKVAVTTLLGVIAVLFIACAPAEEPTVQAAASSAPVAPAVSREKMWGDGRYIYKTNCAPCHGLAGRGDGPAAANLDPKPRDHTNREIMDKISDEEIHKTVQYGGTLKGMPQMPSHPHLKPEDLTALVTFVRTLSHPETAPVPPGTAVTAGDPPKPAESPVTGQ